jgi:hypothetical protein
LTTDVDTLLLDRVFQPVADRLEDWTTCFGLARVSLAAGVALQTAVLAFDIQTYSDPVILILAVGATLLAYLGADQTRALIARVERQSRPGVMNVRRVTLRWQRMAWLTVSACCAGSSFASMELGAVCGSLASLSWVAAVYFLSCSPKPPAARRFRRYALVGT